MLASAAVARMIVLNRLRGTWDDDVDAFIALSEHGRARFAAGKMPADRIFVKPNFVEDPGLADYRPSTSKTVIYAGRLMQEKGVDILLSAWAGEALSKVGELVIVGDGPDRARLESFARKLGLCAPGVTFAGAMTRAEVLSLVQRSRAVVLPSIWLESFGMIIVEAFARGRPAVVSQLGALNEVVQHGHAGLTFPAGDTVMLGSALRKLLLDDELSDEMGTNARALYLSEYTPERNLEMLMSIYRFATERRGANLPERLRHVKAAGPERGACEVHGN
jgi:glycosyltransferase involved in cell wall biosynthesis